MEFPLIKSDVDVSLDRRFIARFVKEQRCKMILSANIGIPTVRRAERMNREPKPEMRNRILDKEVRRILRQAVRLSKAYRRIKQN